MNQFTNTNVDSSVNFTSSKSDLKFARRTRFRSAVHTGSSIFKIVFMFLLLFAVYRVLVNSTPITFSSFLEILQDSPQFDVAKLSSVVPFIVAQ